MKVGQACAFALLLVGSGATANDGLDETLLREIARLKALVNEQQHDLGEVTRQRDVLAMRRGECA